jgi:hypothetical protein
MHRNVHRPAYGDIAILKTWALPRKEYIILDVDNQNLWQQIRVEIEKTSNLLCCTVGEKKVASFLVSVNAKEEFQIHDGARERFLRVPTVPLKDPNVVRKVAYIVRHLARYQAIQRILFKERRTSHLKLTDFSSICTIDKSAEELPRDDKGLYETTAGVYFNYKLKYFSPSYQSVWVAMFELNASWGIQKVLPGYGENADEARGSRFVEHEGTERREISFRVRIKTNVPPQCTAQDPPDAVDQFLVFVCGADGHGAPSWDEISLPPLPHDSALLDVDSFAAYIDGSVGGARAEVERITGPPELKDWNVLGFQVRTLPALDGASS